MNLRNILALLVALAVPLAVGGIGGLATAKALPTWYTNLAKPSWNPPAWVFGPVWTILYILMGLASWLVWRVGWHVPRVRVALAFYAAQLLLNLLWSLIFFGLKNPGLALVEIVLLWGLIAITAGRFLSLVLAAGLLMAPYLLWVTFAALLNASIWWLNRGDF